MLAVYYTECIFIQIILELIVRFLSQATTFSVTQNVPTYQFLKGTIEIYHLESMFSRGNMLKIQSRYQELNCILNSPGVKVRDAPSFHPSLLPGQGVPPQSKSMMLVPTVARRFLGTKRVDRMVLCNWGSWGLGCWPNYHCSRTLFIKVHFEFQITDFQKMDNSWLYRE